MISLSKEWAVLSKAMYGPEFIDELSHFLHKYNLRTILECGCGDGHILQGLAKKGFQGIGIDNDKEMIHLASENSYKNLTFHQMNWLNLGILPSEFDVVMCRGNSLSYAWSWGKKNINPKKTKETIETSITLFFEKLRPGGLLYLDCIPTCESMRSGGNIEIRNIKMNTDKIKLEGRIEYDRKNKIRKTYANGTLNDKNFSVESIGYLLIASELEEMIRKQKPLNIFRPTFVNEKNYEIICAIK